MRKETQKSLATTEPFGNVVEVFGTGLGTTVEVNGVRIPYISKIEANMDLDGIQVSITLLTKEFNWHNELKN